MTLIFTLKLISNLFAFFIWSHIFTHFGIPCARWSQKRKLHSLSSIPTNLIARSQQTNIDVSNKFLKFCLSRMKFMNKMTLVQFCDLQKFLRKKCFVQVSSFQRIRIFIVFLFFLYIFVSIIQPKLTSILNRVNMFKVDLSIRWF